MGGSWLALLVLAHGLGIAAADRGWIGAPAAVVLAALAVGAAPSLRRRRAARAALAGVAVFAAGALALATRLERAAAGRPAGVVEATVEGRVAAVRRTPDGFALDLEQVRAVDEPVGARAPQPRIPRGLRVLGEPTPPGLPAVEHALRGERVRARVRLRAAHGPRNPGDRDAAHALAREGLGAVGKLVHPALHVRVAAERRGGLLDALARARARACARLLERGEAGALLAALALGESAGLSAELRERLARLGLTHLLSISGLHVALVAAGAWAMARRLLVRLPVAALRQDSRRLAVAVALAAAGLYALLSGFAVPVRRALVVVAAVGASFLRRRPGARGGPLALAAGIVLVLDPAALFAPGAQLSFAASAALVFAARSDSAARGLRPALARLLGASAAALAATAPLAALHFRRTDTAGLLANLLAIPWTEAVLLPAALAAAVLAWPGMELPGAAAALAAAEGISRASLAAARAAAGLLPASRPLPPVEPVVLLAATALAVLGVATPRIGLRVGAVALQALLLAKLPAAAIAPGPPRAVFIDVGHGDAALVQGREAAMLVDGGGMRPGGSDLGRVRVLPALAALGVERLALVVATHADLDHRGGLPAVVKALPVGELWLPPGGRSDPAFAELVRIARARRVAVEERARGDPPVAFGDLHVAPLWPPRELRAPVSRNERSLVVRVEVGGRRVLLPGDVGAAAEQALVAAGVDLGADVLALAHHGSRTSSSEVFLRAVQPRLGVASAACAGRFALPHASVRARAAAAGVALAWTGRDGAVLVGLGPFLEVRRWSGPHRGCDAGGAPRGFP